MNYSTLNSDCLQLKYGTLDKTKLKLDDSKFTQDKMDLQHCLFSPATLSRQQLEIYKDKLADARGLSNHRNKFQS